MVNNPNNLSFEKIVLLIALYLLANGIIIFNDGIFWDDWCLYNMSFDGILTQFRGNGAVMYGYLHYYIHQFPNPTLVYNSLTIVLQLGTALLILKIIKLLKLNQYLFYLIVIIASVSPFYMAKNTMICLPYTLSYFLFFLAVIFLILTTIKFNLVYRVLALLFFFSSFFVNSFIVFYIVPFVITYFVYSGISITKFTKESLWKINYYSILKMSDLIILPFIFFLVKKMFFSPQGLYKENYNRITLDNIIDAPRLIVNSFIYQTGNFFELIHQYILIDFEHVIGYLFISVFTYYSIKKAKIDFSFSSNNNIIFFIGLILLLLATIPYVFVQKPPSFLGYDTRHQLLLPLGFSMIGTSAILFFSKREMLPLIFSMVVSVLITISFNMNLQFIKGGLKQQSLVLNFRNNNIIQTEKTLIYYDLTPELDATKGEFRFYSLNGISKMAFGKENKLICDSKTYASFTEKNLWEEIILKGEMYNMTDYKLDEIDAHIKVKEGDYKLDFVNTFKLIYWKIFDKEKAWSEIKDILKVDATLEKDLYSTYYIN